MANVEKMSVALTPEMASMMREVVGKGEYASASEVMREALRDWTYRRTQRERAVDEHGSLWDVGLARGEAVDAEEAFARLERKLDARIVETGIE